MIFPSYKSWLNLLIGKRGYRVVKLETQKTSIRTDMDHEFQPIYEKCRPNTMTSMDNMYAMYKAIEYINSAQILGDIVECGVWKGGSMMIAALTLESLEDKDRQLWLYDTYAGMPTPTAVDINPYGVPAEKRYQESQADGFNQWCMAPLDLVMSNLDSTSYPKDKIKYVQGKVEETIPDNLPKNIALLRLDTDFYESTKHELIHLFPNLSPNGVLILDDYGYWQGCHKAVDEYFSETQVQILLNRVDSTSRVAIKTSNK